MMLMHDFIILHCNCVLSVICSSFIGPTTHGRCGARRGLFHKIGSQRELQIGSRWELQLQREPILWNTYYFLGCGSRENCNSELQFSFGDAGLNEKHKLGRSSTRTVSLRSLFYVMEHLLFLVAFLRRTKNWFSSKIEQKLRFWRRINFQSLLRTVLMEQPSCTLKKYIVQLLHFSLSSP